MTAERGMAVTGEPAFVAETLAWCNTIRAEKGQPPLDRLPKGIKMDVRSCPCGAATGMYVGLDLYGLTDYDAEVLPDAVSEFVAAFDAGLLPQYDAHNPHSGSGRHEDGFAEPPT